ncbi:MAG: ATP-binding cassette domain-containing protein [Clostridia bacterium]|nr:ATP-binding cassette domain-containing protein [Clostridia bacterium]
MVKISLSIKNLTKRFDEKTVITGLSYDFPDKGLYAIVGESGIGKTTLLRIIAGLDADHEGEVVGGGIGQVSFAFQEHRLFPTISALENVIFAISDKKTEAVTKNAMSLLRSLGIGKDDFSLKPDELSGGMKQRVSLARAILKDAPILLLDEPTKELDAGNCEAVLRLIAKEAERRLVIMVSHDLTQINSLGTKTIRLGEK